MTSAVVGPTGGMVASSDGALQVAIPAGALSSDVTVTIVPTPPPGSGSVGTVYEIGPTGTQFAIPVTLTFDYGATNVAGTDPSMLRVATYAGGSWEILSGASLDMQAQTVSGTTMHLSPYGIVCGTDRRDVRDGLRRRELLGRRVGQQHGERRHERDLRAAPPAPARRAAGRAAATPSARPAPAPRRPMPAPPIRARR